jgi:hypothetical protein
MTAREKLQELLADLTYADVREAELPQPALLPSGRRLRAIKIMRHLYLGRDREFYYVPVKNRATGISVRLSLDEVLSLCSPTLVRLRLVAARGYAGARRAAKARKRASSARIGHGARTVPPERRGR